MMEITLRLASGAGTGRQNADAVEWSLSVYDRNSQICGIEGV